MSKGQQIFSQPGVALAIGRLIGTEHGWTVRDVDAVWHVAGVLSYGLIGPPGGGLAQLAEVPDFMIE